MNVLSDTPHSGRILGAYVEAASEILEPLFLCEILEPLVYISLFERFFESIRLPLTSLRIRDQEKQGTFSM